VHDNPATNFTYAPVLTDPSRQTFVFVRIYAIQGLLSSAVRIRFLASYVTVTPAQDTVRYVHEFVVKFSSNFGTFASPSMPTAVLVMQNTKTARCTPAIPMVRSSRPSDAQRDKLAVMPPLPPPPPSTLPVTVARALRHGHARLTAVTSGKARWLLFISLAAVVCLAV
jgi:hypothetical protein